MSVCDLTLELVNIGRENELITLKWERFSGWGLLDEPLQGIVSIQAPHHGRVKGWFSLQLGKREDEGGYDF